MDLGNYGIGGNEVKVDASEAYCWKFHKIEPYWWNS